jgi:hypothetical protein
MHPVRGAKNQVSDITVDQSNTVTSFRVSVSSVVVLLREQQASQR